MMFQYNYDRIDSPIALVADDDDSTRAHVAAYLRAKGYGVLEARTSIEALLLAVDYPDRIDALFTSTRLRKYCNGAELAASLRAARPEMAVFYLECGSPSEEVTRDSIEGKAVLLEKPLTSPRLAEALNLIEENRAWAGTAKEQPEWI